MFDGREIMANRIQRPRHSKVHARLPASRAERQMSRVEIDASGGGLTAAHGGKVKTRAVDIRDAGAVDDMAQWIWDDGGHLAYGGSFTEPAKWSDEDWTRAHEAIKAQNAKDRAARGA